MAASDFTCRDMVELMNDYLEGALSQADSSRFEAHLSICDPCARYLEQIRESVTLTGKLTEVSVPQPVRDDLLETFRGWKSGQV